jgi:hypothetical protein
MTPLTYNEKETLPLLLMIVINRFERSCGTLEGGGRKKPTIINNIGSICLKKEKRKRIFNLFSKNNIDYGVMLT